MDPQLENELLMQIAVGTDPLTAFAALPHEVKTSGEPPTPKKQVNAMGWIVFAVAVLIACWLLMR